MNTKTAKLLRQYGARLHIKAGGKIDGKYHTYRLIKKWWNRLSAKTKSKVRRLLEAGRFLPASYFVNPPMPKNIKRYRKKSRYYRSERRTHEK